jgi:Na+/H+-dicarboxylate symporter
LLKMIVMPVIFTTLVVGAASISPAELGKVGIKIVLFYLLTSAFAVAVGLIMGNLFKPGLGLDLASIGAAAGREITSPALKDTILNIVPKNPFAAIVNGQVLPTIFFAIMFGIGISYLKISGDKRIKDAGDVIFKVFDGAAEVMYMIVRWVLQYAPIGVFARCSYSRLLYRLPAPGVAGIRRTAGYKQIESRQVSGRREGSNNHCFRNPQQQRYAACYHAECE